MTTNSNIYHCCVQKTASQWIKKILADRIVYKHCKMRVFDPGINFIDSFPHKSGLTKSFPANTIISPLYILYEDFTRIEKPSEYKSFYMMRDPRDILVSYYFSTRFSHAENPYVLEKRNILSKMVDKEALSYFINIINNEHKKMYYGMRTWCFAGEKDKNLLVCRYEDLTGRRQVDFFAKLFEHIGLRIPEEKTGDLLKKYRFKKLAKGRERGMEDQKSHFRKGISGDWKNYFMEEHKKAFKDAAGKLLIDLRYEKDMDW
ncbi:sulfotransferase domain-containing protein [Acidobacteriota bacterium]